MSSEHPGFEAAVRECMEESKRNGHPYSEEECRRAIAASSRHASAEAKRENPRLNRVENA